MRLKKHIGHYHLPKRIVSLESVHVRVGRTWRLVGVVGNHFFNEHTRNKLIGIPMIATLDGGCLKLHPYPAKSWLAEVGVLERLVL